MKLGSIIECRKCLDRVFDIKGLSTNIVNNLCDVLEKISQFENKYDKMKNKLYSDYFTYNQEKDAMEIKNIEFTAEVAQKISELNNLEIEIEKKTIPMIPEITPRELSYLREFFVFE